MSQKYNIEKSILEIEAMASTCDYIEGCALIERMKMLERNPSENIDELVGIWEYVDKCCNDKNYIKCDHLKKEMLKSDHDIII